MSTNVYIDAFNLYYGAVKGTAYKWLDIRSLSEKLSSGDPVKRIRYFTARVQARPNDPSIGQRQQTLIRALSNIAGVSVHYGHFLSKPTRMPLASPPASGPQTVEVIRTEEKGSDVNLATYLLLDAFDGDFDRAIVISNDSDLVEPIKVVINRFRLRVDVVNPHSNTSHALQQVASSYRRLRQGVLASSQLPQEVHDARGVIHKPPTW